MRSELLSWGRALFASFLLVFSYVPVVGQIRYDEKASIALIGDKAYVLGEARAVTSGGIVGDFEWSGSGNTALLQRLDVKITSLLTQMADQSGPPPKLTSSLLLWNRKTNALTQLQRYDILQEQVHDFGIMPDDRTVFIITTNSEATSQTLTVIGPSMGSEIVKAGSGEFLGVTHAEGTSTLLVLTGNEEDGSTVRLSLFDTSSRRWTPLDVRLKKNEMIFSVGGRDRNSYFLNVIATESKERTYMRYDIRRNALFPSTESEYFAAYREGEEPTIPITVDFAGETLSDGRKTRSLVLSASKPVETQAKPDKPLHFAVGATEFELTPNGDGILYTLDGMLVYRDIGVVKRELFDRLDGPMTKEMAISNAKQVGLALIMYASDNDDFMPIGDIKEAVMPYCKNEELFNGFIYTYQGGNLSGIKDPANTPLGFIKGPGGTATVYADGSVRWKEDS